MACLKIIVFSHKDHIGTAWRRVACNIVESCSYSLWRAWRTRIEVALESDPIRIMPPSRMFANKLPKKVITVIGAQITFLLSFYAF